MEGPFGDLPFMSKKGAQYKWDRDATFASNYFLARALYKQYLGGFQ